MTERVNSAGSLSADARKSPIEAVEPLDLPFASNGASVSPNVGGHDRKVLQSPQSKGDVTAPFLQLYTASRVPPEPFFFPTMKGPTLLQLTHSPSRSPDAEVPVLCTSPSTVSTQASSSVAFGAADADRNVKELDLHLSPVDKPPSNHNLVASSDFEPLVDRFVGYGESPDGAAVSTEKCHKADTGLVWPGSIPTERRLQSSQGKTLQQLMKAIELPCSKREVVLGWQRCVPHDGCSATQSERAWGTKVSEESLERPLDFLKPIQDTSVSQGWGLGVQGSRLRGKDICSGSTLELSLDHEPVEKKKVGLWQNASQASFLPHPRAGTTHQEPTTSGCNGNSALKSLCCEAQTSPFSFPKLQEGFDTARKLCVQQMRRLAEVFPFDLPGWGRTSLGTEWHIGTILQCENWPDLQVYVWAFQLETLPKITSSQVIQQSRIATMSLRPLTDYKFFESCGDIVARLNAIRWSATVERDNFDRSLHRFIHGPESASEDGCIASGSLLSNTKRRLREERKSAGFVDLKRWIPKCRPKLVTTTVVSSGLHGQRRQPAVSLLQGNSDSSRLLKGQPTKIYSSNTTPDDSSSALQMECINQSISASSSTCCKGSNEEVISMGSSCTARAAVSSSRLSKENAGFGMPWSNKRLKVDERLGVFKSEEHCSCGGKTKVSSEIAFSSFCVNDGKDCIHESNGGRAAISPSPSSNVLQATSQENSFLQTPSSGGSDKERAEEDHYYHHNYSEKNKSASGEVEGERAKSTFGTVFQVNRNSVTEVSFSAAVSAALALLGATVQPSGAPMPAGMTVCGNSLTQAGTKMKGIGRRGSPLKGSSGKRAPESKPPNVGRCLHRLPQTTKVVSQQEFQGATHQGTQVVSEQQPADEFCKQASNNVANDKSSVSERVLCSPFEAKCKEYGYSIKKTPRYSNTEVYADKMFSFQKQNTNNTQPHAASTLSMNAYKLYGDCAKQPSQIIETVPRFTGAENIKKIKTGTKTATTPPRGQETEFTLHRQPIEFSPFPTTPPRGVATGIPLELIRNDDVVKESEGACGVSSPEAVGLSSWNSSISISSEGLRVSPKEKDARREPVAWAMSTDPDPTEKNTLFCFTTPPQRSMKGVSFDRSKRNWEASWLDARTGRRVKKCFSEGRWGSSARKMAILARKEAEDSGLISTRQHQHSAPSSVCTTARHSSGVMSVHQQARERARDPAFIGGKGRSDSLSFSAWRDVEGIGTTPPSCCGMKGNTRLSQRVEDEQECGGCLAGEGLTGVFQSFPRDVVRAAWSDVEGSTKSQKRCARLSLEKGLDDNSISHASLHFPSSFWANSPCRSNVTRLHTRHAEPCSSWESPTTNEVPSSSLVFKEEKRLSSSSPYIEENKLLSASSGRLVDKGCEASTFASCFVSQDTKASVESTGTKTLRPLCFAVSPGYGNGLTTHVESGTPMSNRGSSSLPRLLTCDIEKETFTKTSEQEQPLPFSQKLVSCADDGGTVRRAEKLEPLVERIQKTVPEEKSPKSSTVVIPAQDIEGDPNHRERVISTGLSNRRQTGEWIGTPRNAPCVEETVKEKQVSASMTPSEHMLEGPEGEQNSRDRGDACKLPDTVNNGVAGFLVDHGSELVQYEWKQMPQPCSLYPVEFYHRTVLSGVLRPLTRETDKEPSTPTYIPTATNKHSVISMKKAITEEGFQSVSGISQGTAIIEGEEVPHSESSPCGTKRRKRKTAASPPGRRWTEFQPLPLPPARVALRSQLKWHATADVGEVASLGMPLQCLYKTASCHEMSAGLKDALF